MGGIDAATWRKSTLSFSNGACVEAAQGPGRVGVRDSTLGAGGPVLEVSPAAWAAFTARLR